MERLTNLFNPATVAGLMCRNTLSVSWDGTLHDCDFNQMLDIPVATADGRRPHIRDFDPDDAPGPADPDAAPLLRLHRGGGQLLRGRHGVRLRRRLARHPTPRTPVDELPR